MDDGTLEVKDLELDAVAGSVKGVARKYFGVRVDSLIVANDSPNEVRRQLISLRKVWRSLKKRWL